MNLTNKQIRLIDETYIRLHGLSIAEKYEYLQQLYKDGKRYFLLNNTRLFGPYPRPEVSWDISEAQKIVTYQQDVVRVNKWLLNEIFDKSALFNYKTLDVLIRIATGMLNNCNISKELQIMFHDNMVENLKAEHNRIVMSDLPF